MVKLYLARHGETEENVAQVLQGITPGHLTPKGIEQADELRQSLLGLDISFDALLCSDIKRCIDTANIVNKDFGLEVVLCPLLRERDWGSMTGMYIPDVRGMQFPDDVESVDDMFVRAGMFLEYVSNEYDGKTVLAVGHGLFDRVIHAAFNHCTIADIPRMGNAEVRTLLIPANYRYESKTAATDVSKADN